MNRTASVPPGSALDFTRVNTRRSLVLLAIGAAFGIGIAGFGLFTAKGTRIHGVPPEDIALVNQRPILRSDFVTQVQTQYSVRFADATPEQRRKVLDDMIDEEMLVQRGLEVDLPSFDPDVRSALVAGVELQLFADVLAQRPTEAELQAWYDTHRATYVRDGVMQMRDLLAAVGPQRPPAEAQRAAAAAVTALRHGAALDPVMQQFNLVDSRRLLDSGHVDTGDVFDFAARARLDPAVFAAARVLGTGQISDPVPAADGVHVVVMVRRVAPAQRSFAEVSNEVWRDVTEEAKRRVRANNLRYLRSKADIQVASP
ncbi:MAG TPA: peptidyl-prolyl cis-trans isomerase [Steroidobacteraceae bacterium]|nr:peptidyl-prolyl cis-trans isomerase [Steroidobacteraceae bacterium]